MLYIDGRLVGKPASIDAARREWQSMGGRSGQLHTGHCLHPAARRPDHTGRRILHHHSAFRRPRRRADLDAYLDSGESLGVAGAFTLDGLGGWFVDRIDGDPSNVIGLSLPHTRALLQRVGVSIADLWAANPVPS